MLRELWKALSFCTSPGQHFKMCLECVCTAQDWDPLMRPIRNSETLTGHSSMTDFLRSCSSLGLSKYQFQYCHICLGMAQALHQLFVELLYNRLCYTGDSNPWIWGVHILVCLGSLPLTYCLPPWFFFKCGAHSNSTQAKDETCIHADVCFNLQAGEVSTEAALFHHSFLLSGFHVICLLTYAVLFASELIIFVLSQEVVRGFSGYVTSPSKLRRAYVDQPWYCLFCKEAGSIKRFVILCRWFSFFQANICNIFWEIKHSKWKSRIPARNVGKDTFNLENIGWFWCLGPTRKPTQTPNPVIIEL